MTEGPPAREFEVVVKPGFAATIGGLLLVYLALYAYAADFVSRPVPFAGALNWATGVVILVLLGSLLHELGHVAVGLLHGHRWTRFVLSGGGIAAVIDPEPRGGQRVARSLAGPAVQALVSIPLLSLAGFDTLLGGGAQPGVGHSMWWVGGVSNLVLALVNLLPVRGWDGGEVLAGIRELRAERRS